MINETQLLTLAGMLVAALFGVLTTLVGWMGSRVIQKLEDVVDKLNEVAGELHQRINGLDNRVTAIETRCSDTLAGLHGLHVHHRYNDTQ